MKVIAIIPARKGSKGLPGKNIMPLKGKPLIAYSIEKALEAKYIDDVYISTDCEKIAKIAKKYKGLVPILRPDEISQDNSTDKDFIRHWLDFLISSNNQIPELIVQLRPTSPIRNTKNIEKGIEMMFGIAASKPDKHTTMITNRFHASNCIICIPIIRFGFP